MKESFGDPLMENEAESAAAPQHSESLREHPIENELGLDIVRYEEDVPAVHTRDGDVIMGAHVTEGWRARTEDLVISAQRVKGSDGSFGITFWDKDGGKDFTHLSKKGMFAAKAQLDPVIRLIDKETQGNWHASCDDEQRARVYARWLPKEKIVME